MSPRGRPRAFDREHALTQAMLVFWERGYDGASLAELTEAMGIKPPSLYAAFGDKETLFREAIEHYQSVYGQYTMRALTEESTARAAVEAMLRDNARAYVEPGHPKGCMVVLAATNCTQANASVWEFLAASRDNVRRQLRERLRRGVEDGDLAATVDTDALSALYATVFYGLTMQARDGVSLDSLMTVIDLALSLWPENGGGAASTVDTVDTAPSAP
ncbi:TetR family transcriptional regulator [Amycolatopsis echigonensis]|uniref:TetR family transcriptional regulator n=1 Tax=Amycolatopsis echigonensis TaxID=2576905 RepID=A0A2N3WDZ5_9PSEU|nr:TetR/AcrR family transcriptional regulator [Amycolatopsis niigatensis]PKV92029.1 TetR family transcriptional regulator [Amycolatopsis niigatensis]